MGGILSRLFSWGDREYRVLIIGLDGAGKTTILYRLHSGQVQHTIPTVGFNIESVTVENVKIQVWDLGGQTAIRPYWRCYYAKTDGIVFVIDSHDRERLSNVGFEFKNMIQEEELRGLPVLVMANKKDLPGGASEAEIKKLLNIQDLKDREVAVKYTSALTGEGLDDAFKWLSKSLQKKQGFL